MVQVVGQRQFRTGPDMVETTRYHLSPDFTPRLSLFAEPTLCLSVHVHLTDEAGRELPSAKASRRRKKICGSWWNHHWLSRQLAIMDWLSEGEKAFNISSGTEGIKVSSVPYQLTSSVGVEIDSRDTFTGDDEAAESEALVESDIEDDEAEL